MHTRSARPLALAVLIMTGCATTTGVGTGPGEITYDSLARHARNKLVRVREVTGARQSGTLLAIDADSVILNGASRIVLRTVDVAELAVRPNRSSGALLGGLVGGAVGGVVGAVSVTCDPPACKQFVIGLGVAGGALAGLVIGGNMPWRRFIIGMRE